MTSVVTCTPAGSPSRIATSAGPCDSPAVNQRSMVRSLPRRLRRTGSESLSYSESEKVQTRRKGDTPAGCRPPRLWRSPLLLDDLTDTERELLVTLHVGRGAAVRRQQPERSGEGLTRCRREHRVADLGLRVGLAALAVDLDQRDRLARRSRGGRCRRRGTGRGNRGRRRCVQRPEGVTRQDAVECRRHHWGGLLGSCCRLGCYVARGHHCRRAAVVVAATTEEQEVSRDDEHEECSCASDEDDRRALALRLRLLNRRRHCLA